MNDTDIMPFGVHKDKEMSKVPASYLLWLYDKMVDEGGPYGSGIQVFEYIEQTYSALESDAGDYIPKHRPAR